MNKDNLKVGMIVETRKGERFVVLDKTMNNMSIHFPLCYYDYNLTHMNGLSEWDIMKIFASDSSGILEMLDNKHQLLKIWEREEDNRKEVPRQMDYLKDLYLILYRKNGDIRVPCYGLNCDKCPLKVYDGDCLQIKMRTELEKVNKEWKLDK